MFIVGIKQKLLEKLSNNPVDVAISPENEVTSHLIELINHPGAEQIEEFASGKVKLVSVNLRSTQVNLGNKTGLKQAPGGRNEL